MADESATSSLAATYEKTIQARTFQALPRPQGRVLTRIFEPPEPRHSYSIGVDVSEGIVREDRVNLAQLNVTQLPDFNCACVIDNVTNTQVAVHRSLEAPAVFAKKVFCLYLMYEEPLVVVEANGPGIAVINKLEELNCRNLYTRLAVDRITKVQMKRKGWKTTSTNRGNLIRKTYESLLDEDGILVVSASTCSELMTFLKNRNGREEAAPGAKDDEVFALMLAIEGRSVYYRSESPLEEKLRGHPDKWVWQHLDEKAKSAQDLRQEDDYGDELDND